jgi:hypothetical protein
MSANPTAAKNRLRYSTYTLASILGLVLLLLAPLVKPKSDYAHEVLVAAGGAMMAIGLSSLVALLVGSDNEDIVQLLFKKDLMLSPTDDIKPYVGKWYSYWVTKKSQTDFWNSSEFTLERGSYSGALEGRYSITSPDGEEKRYGVSCALRGDSVIVVDSAESGKEPASVSIYPYMGHLVPHVFAGLAFHETWDLDFAISPCLLSRVPLHEEQLDKLWLDGMKGRMGQNIILRLRRQI